MPKTEHYYNSFFVKIIDIWNNLPARIKDMDLADIETNTCFKKSVKEFYKERLEYVFDCDDICSWVMKCRCTTCRLRVCIVMVYEPCLKLTKCINIC